MLNIIYLPFILIFLCGVILRAENKFYLIVLYTDIGLMHIFILYFIIKCIILPIIEIFYQCFLKKKCLKDKNYGVR
jgi:hypothetical protein